MRKSVLIAVILLPVLMLPAAARAQAPISPFEDVPPWHWAFDAVEKLAREGIIQGYPRNDRDLARNSVTQVYEAFAHASHPSARAWAEAFLTNLPSGWPTPLERSNLVSFRLTEQQVRLEGSRGTVSLLAAVTLRGASAPVRARVTASVVRDEGGRWRVDYASLVRGQPNLFR
ncbi:MAG TPA: S-layer homology domain-containing protein [bacterium]|nr:S-layer homology domain-containing protein [bacterium]